MSKLVLVLTLCVIDTSFETACQEDSFPKIPVWVEEYKKASFQIVKGCITSEKLKYNPDQLRYIRIRKQNFTTLKRGAVANILTNFTLQIENNSLTTIEEDAFLNLPQVLEIDVNKNMINWIEANTFSNLHFLVAIDLSNNQLEMLLQNTFYNVPNLEIIDFHGNKLEVFNQFWFYNAQKLDMIMLDDNRISSIPKAAFITLSNLTAISLSNNKISYIHRLAFQGLQYLIALVLERNRIKNIDFDYDVIPNLKSFDVSLNQINYITEHTLTSLRHTLTFFDIYFNPWQCSCINKILEWGNLNNIKVQWKCKNTDLFCVVPKINESECVKLTEDDFYSGYLNEFTGVCKKLVE